jgi:hypothetical protein
LNSPDNVAVSGTTSIEVETAPLERLADTVTISWDATALATIWKVALVLPAATVTAAGAAIAELLTAIAGTTAFTAGEAKLTVQLAVPSGETLAGEQLIALNCTAVLSVIGAVRVCALNEAVKVATELVVIVPAVAPKEALL